MPRALVQPRTLAALALVAGVLQILATVNLGLAPVRALESAAAEGAQLYVLTVAAVAGTLGLAWTLRRRPLLAAGVFVGSQALLFWPLLRRLSRLGLALHGETILHHFLTAICVAMALKLVFSWRDPDRLGARRASPIVAVVGIGGAFLVAAHVVGAMRGELGWLQPVGTGAMLGAWLLGLALAWPKVHNRRLWGIAAALLVPVLVRVIAAGPAGLGGAPVDPQRRAIVMGAVVAAALVVFVLFRPRVEPRVRLTVATISGLSTAAFYRHYRQGFGELEDGIDGLTRSLFGFNIPYPTYVGTAQVITVAIAICLILYVVYVGLVSTPDRRTGLALGLLAITGIGLTTPQLVLMDAAGFLLLLDQAMVDTAGAVPTRPPASDLESVVTDAAQRLGLPTPTVLQTRARPVIALRGETGGVPVDARARPHAQRWTVSITLGVPGRSRPDLALVPRGTAAGRITPIDHHPLTETHGATGDIRQLEQLDDAVLDALLPFAGARLELWGAGAKVELGEDLAALDGQTLAAIILAVRDHLGVDDA